ncbi:MAG: hypothetical protein B6244_06905 [Candidatus Cloacimonetes bacterium 4572_55]|nr:MAG: hypothetical protein B6244_06905 [Candidatus Cloacimonetes bacterium 4572_55]
MIKILVIEDRASIRENIAEILELEGYEPIQAEDGIAGVREAIKHRPNLILSDILMPGLDGYGVLRKLRGHPETALIPFIFLTAKTARKDVRQGMDFGADDYITKPFTVEELLATIQMRLSKYQRIQERFENLRLNLSTALPHEMRTPLTVIMGIGELISDSNFPLKSEEITEMGRIIYKNSARLHHLIENYLLFVNLTLIEDDPDKLSLLRKSYVINAGSIITSVALRKAEAAKRSSDLILNLPCVPLQLSEDRLQKIMDEIIDNSLKFSQPGARVQVIGTIEGHQFSLQIIDHGRGMTPEQIASVGAYVQFDRQLHEQSGSGLGLVLAKKLAELFNGSLTIASVPNEQTVVTLILPIAEQERQS